jgi:nickel-dependent lactate racemase
MIRHNPPSVRLAYGKTGLELPLNRNLADWFVVEPDEPATVGDFDFLFKQSIQNPISSPLLIDIISENDQVVIVTSDNTRPVPNRSLIKSLFEQCHIKPENTTILIGGGSHRPHSPAEISELLGDDIVAGTKTVCHDARNLSTLKYMGTTRGDIPVYINKNYVESDKKIVLGFVEPHFFAGYSGGPKGICPAICGLKTINAFHSFDIIGDPNSDYGILEGNPQYAAARDAAQFAPPDYLINVILSSRKETAAIYSGDFLAAHMAATREVGRLALAPLDRKFPVAITTNSGYPLDQNLYQTVKGIWTAARIVQDGGTIVAVSECSKGIPEDGEFSRLMSLGGTPDEILNVLKEREGDTMDRWQAQKLSMAMKKAKIMIFTALNKTSVERCGMKKISDLSKSLGDIIAQYGTRPEVAVLPQGPLSAPYLAGNKV